MENVLLQTEPRRLYVRFSQVLSTLTRFREKIGIEAETPSFSPHITIAAKILDQEDMMYMYPINNKLTIFNHMW